MAAPRRPRRRPRRTPPAATAPARLPEVRLGRLHPDGVAASMFGLLERGAERRPEIARSLRGKAVFRFEEPFAPMRITFGSRVIRVEDGDVRSPDLAISGRLPDIVHFATVETWRGFPNPRRPRGRVALGLYARGQVRIEGDRRLARSLVQLLAI